MWTAAPAGLGVVHAQLRAHLSPIQLREALEAAAGWKAARLALSERSALAVVPVLRRHGLAVAIGHGRYVHRTDVGKGGWSNRVEAIVPDDEGRGDVYVYVADDVAAAGAALEAEGSGSGDAFGALLGIPACCRRAYDERVAADSGPQNDPVPATAWRTRSAPPHAPWNNVAAQYFGYSLLSHAPCSLDCEASARQARRAHRLLAGVDRALAVAFLRSQRASIVYTEWEGIHRLEAASWTGDGLLRYGRVASKAGGALAEALVACDALRSFGTRGFELLRAGRVAERREAPEEVALFLCGGRRRAA